MKDIINSAKDIKKIVNLDLDGDWQITDALIKAYLEASGFNLSNDFDSDDLNALKVPNSTIVEWLKENVIEYYEGRFVTEYNYED